jgi:sulfatase maturation enzyme AslB (radical SAM superfamily)
MAQLRQDMLDNRANPGCEVCRHNERHGGTSDRSWYQSMYGRVTDTKLSYLEFNLGNLCNFKCRMCWSGDSTKWIADDKALNRTVMPAVRRGLADICLDLSSIDRIKFKGGEPSLEQDAMIDILKHIDAVRGLQNLSVSITTNGSAMFEPNLIMLLDRCASVNINISVDGIGQINDYQRTGAVWSEIEKNLLTYQQTVGSRYNLCIAITWTVLNVRHAVEFMRWIVANLPKFTVYSGLLHSPRYLSINNLPANLKATISEDLSAYTQHDHPPWVSHCRSQLISKLTEKPSVSSKVLRDNLSNLDKIRHEDLSSVDSVLYQAIYSN